MSNAWQPTHLIVFTSEREHDINSYLLQLGNDGSAHTLAEWHAEVRADWCRGEDGTWLWRGQATPGGEPGTVEVEDIEDGPSFAFEADLDGGDLGPHVHYMSGVDTRIIEGALPDGWSVDWAYVVRLQPLGCTTGWDFSAPLVRAEAPEEEPEPDPEPREAGGYSVVFRTHPRLVEPVAVLSGIQPETGERWEAYMEQQVWRGKRYGVNPVAIHPDDLGAAVPPPDWAQEIQEWMTCGDRGWWGPRPQAARCQCPFCGGACGQMAAAGEKTCETCKAHSDRICRHQLREWGEGMGRLIRVARDAAGDGDPLTGIPCGLESLLSDFSWNDVLGPIQRGWDLMGEGGDI